MSQLSLSDIYLDIYVQLNLVESQAVGQEASDYFVATSAAGLRDSNFGRSVSPILKYFNHYWVDCHEIWYRH